MSTGKPYLGPDPVRQLTDGGNSGRVLSAAETHSIFRSMVTLELSCGRLSPFRRRKLVQYAASLHISAVDAGRLIQEAIREDQGDDDKDGIQPGLHLAETTDAVQRWPNWAKLLTVLGLVGTAEALIWWLLGV